MTLSSNTKIVSDSLAEIKNALINKNIDVTGDINTYAQKIIEIGNYDTSIVLEISPSTSQQYILAPSDIGSYNHIIVAPVTSNIDANIIPENIKSGVNILNINGNLDANLISGTLNITSNGNYNISNYENIIVNVPSESEICGLNMDYLLGDIDNNGILQTPAITNVISFKDVVDLAGHSLSYIFYKNENLTSIDFPSLTTISGDNGMSDAFEDCTNLTSVSFPSLTTISGRASVFCTFSGCTSLTSIDFPSLTTISGDNCMYYAFEDCTNLTSVSFPSLTTISSNKSMCNAFYNCTSLTSVSFPSLTTISGSETMSYAFYKCTNLTSIDFPSLTTIIGGSDMYRAFYNCTSLTSVSFPSLTSSSFGGTTNQFNNMLKGVTGCTIHFPSNLESVIGSWSDVTSGFGGTDTVVAFDLPATS